ncbi:hypothetical protein EDB87DRAFT_1593423 [Lactarius vividus]|nr:hypothetical protein EDB87DRAFT_1593423 [Lactarius vividus]
MYLPQSSCPSHRSFKPIAPFSFNLFLYHSTNFLSLLVFRHTALSAVPSHPQDAVGDRAGHRAVVGGLLLWLLYVPFSSSLNSFILSSCSRL